MRIRWSFAVEKLRISLEISRERSAFGKSGSICRIAEVQLTAKATDTARLNFFKYSRGFMGMVDHAGVL